MKKKNIFIAIILLIVLLSITTSTASAVILGPKEMCKLANGIYDNFNQICYWKQKGPPYGPNICYPLWDKAIWTGGGYTFVGCVDLRDIGITTPKGGFAYLFPAEFTYDPGTCDGKCRVITSGITAAAKAALGDLPGKVVGKAYVQILDLEGNPTTGNFKLCLKAKNAKNPAFFRYTKSGWQYFGGYWSGKKFCMSGDTSGNYVLVDVKE